MRKSLVLALVLSALLLVTVMAVSVSADASLTINTVTYSKDVANNVVTFTVPYTAVEVDQITVLAVKGPQSAEPAATESNIVYFNQQSSASSSFTFSVPYSAFTAELPYCWIKIGGTSIATAKSDGGKEIWSNSVSVFVYGDVDDDGEVTATDVVYVTKYAAAYAAEDLESLDPLEFPDGTFAVGSIVPADVDGDEEVTATDVVYITKYAAAYAAEDLASLDPVEFPGGKFPAEAE